MWTNRYDVKILWATDIAPVSSGVGHRVVSEKSGGESGAVSVNFAKGYGGV